MIKLNDCNIKKTNEVTGVMARGGTRGAANPLLEDAEEGQGLLAAELICGVILPTI